MSNKTFVPHEVGRASRQFLAFASVAVVALLVILFWKDRDAASGTDADYDRSRALSSARPKVNGRQEMASLSVRPNADRISQPAGTASRTGREGFAFLVDARSLVMSKNPAHVEYALRTASLNCLVLALPERAVKERREAVRKIAATGQPGFGQVDEIVMGAARSGAEQRCKILFPIGTNSLSDDVRASARKANSEAYERTLDIARTLREADANDPAFRGSLDAAVSGPMFASIRTLLSDRWDFSELAGGYPASMGEPMKVLAIQLLLCRFGDDCGAEGTVTSQMCWHSGVCDGDFESALLRNLTAQGIDPAGLIRFVTLSYERLQRREISEFLRKPRLVH